MKHLFIFITITIYSICAIDTQAQNTIPTLIDNTLTLNRGNYTIANNVKITKNATLIINPGVTLFFNAGTTIIVEGGLSLDGELNDPINIISSDFENEGIGFEITGISNTEINIKYANISNIVQAFKFTRNWRRNIVSINNSRFENINTGEAAIKIQEPDNFSSDESIMFLFSANSFISNQSNIYIQELESDVLDLRFEHNLISGNIFKGFERGGNYSTPVFSVYNKRNKKYKTIFENNSIFNNYLINDQNDTIIAEVNFGISGSTQNFDIPNNFWGDKSEEEILNTVDHFVNNNQKPYLDPNPFLKEPVAICPPHIWKMRIENKTVDYNRKLPKQETFFIELLFNSIIDPSKNNIKLDFYYIQESGSSVLNKQITEYTFLNTNDQSVIQLMVSDKIFAEAEYGYLIINGFKNEHEIIAPGIELGKNSFKVYREKKRIAEKNFIINQVLIVENRLIEIKDLNQAPDVVETELNSLQILLDNMREIESLDNQKFRRITELTFDLDSLNTRNNLNILEIKLDSLNTKAGKRSKLRYEFQRLKSELDSIRIDGKIRSEDLKQNVNLISIQIDQLENLMTMFKLFDPLINNWDVGLNIGNAFYYGDLSTERFWDSKYTYMSAGGFLRYNLDDKWAMKMNYSDFNIGMYSSKLGTSFRSRHNELSLQAEYTLLPIDKYSFSPFFATGMKFFRSTNINSSTSENIPVGISIPITAGIKIPTFKNWIFSLNIEVNKPITDGIDYYTSGGFGDYYFVGFFEISRLIR